MAAPKKIKVYRVTLKHGNTYTAGPYHFSLGRPVDILERDAKIAEYLKNHPSFTVVETYVDLKGATEEAIPQMEPTQQEETTGGDAETESAEVVGETAAAHAEITQAPKAAVAPRRVPGARK